MNKKKKKIQKRRKKERKNTRGTIHGRRRKRLSPNENESNICDHVNFLKYSTIIREFGVEGGEGLGRERADRRAGVTENLSDVAYEPPRKLTASSDNGY